jgi:hypothetical protein
MVDQSAQGYPRSETRVYNVPSLLGVAYSAPLPARRIGGDARGRSSRVTHIETAGGTMTIDAALTARAARGLARVRPRHRQ